MTDITVIRGNGDIAGDDIQSPILCSAIIARTVGRVTIDTSTPASEIAIEANYRPDIMPGDLVEVMEESGTWRAQVLSISHRMSHPSGRARTEVKLWKPAQ
jgi:hypothetical protein